jgi:hypothetical protein
MSQKAKSLQEQLRTEARMKKKQLELWMNDETLKVGVLQAIKVVKLILTD